jgi:hypothetical protein
MFNRNSSIVHTLALSFLALTQALRRMFPRTRRQSLHAGREAFTPW